MRKQTKFIRTSDGVIINIDIDNLELIKTALRSHINQCENFNLSYLSDKEQKHVKEKVFYMTQLLEEFK